MVKFRRFQLLTFGGAIMIFTRTRRIVFAVLVVISLFVALRVYGAYQQERNNALKRAVIAEQKEAELNAELEHQKQRSDCNLRWTKYETARLDKRIADMRGTRAPVPIEPSCTGYAMRLDSVLADAGRTFQLIESASAAGIYAKYERVYADSRMYQTRYLFIRFWAFLTGTEPQVKQAEMVRKIERAKSLETCKQKAQDDLKRKACETMFGEES